MDQRNTVSRARAVCKIVASKKPHAVFLQEVVPSTELEILKQLGSDYDYYAAPNAGEKYRYFVAFLVLKTDKLRVSKELVSVDLPDTVMGRHLLICSVLFFGVEINLLTSHLESMKDYGKPRKVQLSKVFEIMSQDGISNSIFGGDLNIRDSEVKSVGVPPNTVDVWAETGSNEAHKFTWDISKNDNLHWTYPNKPKARYDRVYLQSRDGRVRANSFSLVGKDRLEDCRRFPSDHWGLSMDFTVQV